MDFNVSVPARHHHPGPAEAHGDFHGWRIPDWRLLASEQKRGEQREDRSARGAGRSMGYKAAPVFLHKRGTKCLSADPTLLSDHLFGLSLCSLLSLSRSRSLISLSLLLSVSLSLSVELARCCVQARTGKLGKKTSHTSLEFGSLKHSLFSQNRWEIATNYIK